MIHQYVIHLVFILIELQIFLHMYIDIYKKNLEYFGHLFFEFFSLISFGSLTTFMLDYLILSYKLLKSCLFFNPFSSLLFRLDNFSIFFSIQAFNFHR